MYPVQERVSLRSSADGPFKTTYLYPQVQNQRSVGNSNGTIISRGCIGFRLTVVVPANPGSGSVTPSVQEVSDTQVVGKTWTKSSAIIGVGTYTMTVYPGLLAASGNDDKVNDVLGYMFQVLLTHNNANTLAYDAYIDLIP
jgi:hypothetical protein